jgi:phosphate transport system permease protein
LTVLAILALIAYTTVRQAWPAFRQEGLSFITSDTWIPSQEKFGGLAFIYGTVVSSAIALVFAVPMSLGIALFTTELVTGAVRRWVTYIVDLLAAIPSVVYGYWALTVLIPPITDVYRDIADSIGTWPLFKWFFAGPVSGASLMTAGIILAVMILPIITALSREALATVSQDDKNAALAMGATRWEMLRATVFPRVRPGLVGAVMLGLGRAMGETIAVALTIGASPQITSKLFQPGDSMAAVIAHEFGEATGTHRAALIGLGVVLFVLTIVVNMIARFIANRTTGAYRAGSSA